MTLRVERTVSLISPKSDKRYVRDGLSLADLRSDHSYVLLGEPGLGKSTAFMVEARRTNSPKPVTAQQFIRGVMEDYRGEGPLFIDGLDAIRTSDPGGALNMVLKGLALLGNPPFRLSCRLSTWPDREDGLVPAFHAGAAQIPILQLNTLSNEDVRQIVASRNEDASAFMLKALDHGLNPLLWNPQMLERVLKSVEADGWPSSPTAAFETSCRILLQERIATHLGDRHSGPSEEAVLDAAGELFALMLITGKAGWTEAAAGDRDMLSLEEVNGSEAHRRALKSRLFKGPVATDRFVAEFLGAKFLNSRIRNCEGVTLRRVLSLLMGHDAVPLTHVRRLAAWLASLNANARRILIRADPIAIAFFGDATNLGAAERKELLENLEQHPELSRGSPSRLSLGALSGRQGLMAIRVLTESDIRTDARQHLVRHLLLGYLTSHGPPIEPPNAECEALLGLIRDASWWDEIRCNAVSILNHLLAKGPAHARIMLRLARSILDGLLPDKRNKLLGTILTQLYPGDLQPKKVWDFLDATPHGAIAQYDAFEKFWTNLADQSGGEQVGALLDSLCDHAAAIIPKLAKHGQEPVVLKLLAKGLEISGDEMSTPAIYRWFELLEYDIGRSHLVPAHCRDHRLFRLEDDKPIRDWLRSHRRIQYELIEYGLAAKQSKIGQKTLTFAIGCKFAGSQAPSGFREWCLSRAAELWDTQPAIAKELAHWSVWSHEGWEAPLSDDQIATAAHDSPELLLWHEQRIAAEQQFEAELEEERQRVAASLSGFQKRHQAELAAIRQQKADLAQGRCKPALLHTLAQEYLDGLAEIGSADDPIARLNRRLDDDPALVEAALAGLRSLLTRDDLPDLEQIAELHENNRFSLYALPFLAGMEEVERDSSDPLDHLDGRGRRRALGFHFVARLPARRYPGRLGLIVQAGMEAGPAWFQRALSRHPKAVADALVRIHNAQVRKKASPDQYLFDLGHKPEYNSVAALALRRMFTVFPSRCTRAQVESLRAVLWAAVSTGGMSTVELRILVLKRLRRKSLDLAQRAHWLCAGLFVAREHCVSALEGFLEPGSPVRVRHLCSFFNSHPPRLQKLLHLAEWSGKDLARMIRMLGKHLRPISHPDTHGRIGHNRMVQHGSRQLVASCIQNLADHEGDEAARALESLFSDPDLNQWLPMLESAQLEHGRAHRAAMHETFSVAQIQAVLSGSQPAGAADMTALVVDILEHLAIHIRNDATSDWREYWNSALDKWGLDVPRTEHDCVRRLRSELTLLLEPYGVAVDPTPGDRNGADIQVRVGPDLAVPVVINRNMHPQAWRAVEEKLVTLSAREPKAAGYGIYVVLWYGCDFMYPPLGGHPPATPDALKRQLKAGISAEHRAKIAIVVIDVSPPGRSAEGVPCEL
ncbi:MAG: hypothetical protein OXM02_13700 [Bacteroidota bacterium]|nr:hypothetical protein [Bacteroidota bacterium]